MDFFGTLCSQRPLLIMLHAGGWVGVVLNSVTLLYTGPAGRTLALVNYFGLMLLIAWTGYVLWRCNRIQVSTSPVEQDEGSDS